jgi:hypothetical protein
MTDSRSGALRFALARAPEDVDVDDVRPVLVPQSFLTLGNWPGPSATLRAPGLAMTWAVLTPAQTMLYVSHALASFWEQRAIDWRARAMQNLRREAPWTHTFSGGDGRLYGVAMMHADGLGPSRLLLRDQLARAFPEGYRVAAPERSCGVAFRSMLLPEEEARMRRLVTRCFTQGTNPLLADIWKGDDLAPIP